MKITWFGHSAFRVETAKSVLLIDPYLSDNPVFDGSVEASAGSLRNTFSTVPSARARLSPPPSVPNQTAPLRSVWIARIISCERLSSSGNDVMRPSRSRLAPCHSSQRQRRNGRRPGGSGWSA